MLITGSISAFINTTAVVIVFIKIIEELLRRFDLPQAKLLLPISFAGILGGSCTLMGTSTNLIVYAVARDLGADKIGFFEFSFFGIIFLLIGIVVITITTRRLPTAHNETIEDEYKLDNFVTAVTIKSDSDLIGKTIENTFLYQDPDISILKLTRNKQVTNAPGRYITLKENDKLMLMCDLENLAKLNDTRDLIIRKDQDSKK